MLFDGTQNSIASDGKAGADEWARLLAFNDGTRRQHSESLRRFEFFQAEEL